MVDSFQCKDAPTTGHIAKLPTRLTPYEVLLFIKNFLKMADGKYGGDTTINELRVMNQIYRCAQGGLQCGPTLVGQKLDIPRSTVGRAVVSLIESGWVTETEHPDDGRRRILRLSEKAESTLDADWHFMTHLVLDDDEVGRDT